MAKALLGKLKQLPYLREAVWSIKYRAVGTVAPFNGRWERLARLLDQLNSAAPPPLDERRVLVFASNDYWIEYLMPVAAVLAGRGCQIDFLWLPHLDLPGPEEVERFRRWSLQFKPPQHERFRVLSLIDYEPAPAEPEFAGYVERSARFDTCYFTAKESCDPEHDPRDAEVYRARSERNLEALCRLKTFLAGRRYDSALTANAKLCEYGAFHWYCTRSGLPCASVDSFEADDQVIASQTFPCTNWDTEAVWKADEPHVLTPEREKRVLERIAFRDNPQLQTDRWHQLQAVSSAEPDQVRRALNLDPARRLALLCTNVCWDSAVIGRGRAFPSLREWYPALIRWFAARPDWQMVVRTHPVEAKLKQPVSVSEYIDRDFPTLPPNVRLVRPADKVNTYGLMKIADLGLVFTSTVGLEMTIRGLPVILAGRVHYAGKGFTWEPANQTEYFALLERATGPDRLALTPRQVELARCYFDAYFEKFPKKMPWRWSHLWDDMKKWPISRLAAGDCPEDFLKTFDYLAGRKVEGLF